MAPGWECDADWAWAVSAESETGEGQRDFRGLEQRSPHMGGPMLTLVISISNSLSQSHKRFMNES